MRRITFDIETEGDFRTNGDFSNLELTIVGVHDSETNALSSYLKPELPELWKLFEKADLLVGYNSDHFDIPILNRYYAGNLSQIRSIDLMKELKNVLGRRLKLDNVAEATLGRRKSGSGSDAGKWFREGKIEKLRSYCLDDVALTNELYLYAVKNGSLKYKDFDGVREIKLDTSQWEKPIDQGSGLTHTLPF